MKHPPEQMDDAAARAEIDAFIAEAASAAPATVPGGGGAGAR